MILIAFATLSGCTAARWYLERSSCREEPFLGGWLQRKSLWNEGAAFGLPVPKKALPLLSAAALATLPILRRRSSLGAGLILGGALSNLAERFLHGKVYDYIRFPKAPGPLKRYAFNLADLFIFAGGILVLSSAEKKKKS